MNILQNFPINLKNNKLILNVKDNCPCLKIKFRFRGKEYYEEFKQQSLNNNELWECSCNSYLFTNKIYNIYKTSENQQIELDNLNNLISGDKVKILNFTNDMYDHDEWLEEFAELI